MFRLKRKLISFRESLCYFQLYFKFFFIKTKYVQINKYMYTYGHFLDRMFKKY